MLLGSRSLSLASRTVSSLHRERLWVAGRGLPFPEPAQGQGWCPIQSFSQREGHFQLLGWNLVLWGVSVFGVNEEVLGEREPASTQSEKGQMCQGWFSGQQTWALLVRQEVLGLHAHTAVMFWLPEYCLRLFLGNSSSPQGGSMPQCANCPGGRVRVFLSVLL